MRWRSPQTILMATILFFSLFSGVWLWGFQTAQGGFGGIGTNMPRYNQVTLPGSYLIDTNTTHYFMGNTTSWKWDYVGTSFTKSINFAIGNISTVYGGWIYLRPGSFNIGTGETISVNRDGIHLQGAGLNSTRIIKTGSNPASSTYMVTIGKSGGRISDFSISDMEFIQSGGSSTWNKKVFYLKGTLRGTIRDVSATYVGTFFTIEDFNSETYANRRLLIENVKAYDLYGWYAFIANGTHSGAIHFQSPALINSNIGIISGTGAVYSNDTDGGTSFIMGAFQKLDMGMILKSDGSSYVVQRCSLEQTDGNSTYPAALYVDASYSTIEYNVINNNGYHGIWIDGYHNFLADNYIKEIGQTDTPPGNTYDGIVIEGAKGSQIHNNIMINTASASRYMYRGIDEISGNYNMVESNLVRYPADSTNYVHLTGASSISYSHDNVLMNSTT